MTIKTQSLFDKSCERVYNAFDQLFRGCEPHLYSLENQVRNNIKKVETTCERLCNNAPTQAAVKKLQYFIPLSPQETILKVGKASLSIRGSFPVFHAFIQKLIEYQCGVARGEIANPGAHTRLAKALIEGKKIFDSSVSTLNTIKDFSNKIQNERNQLLLLEQTSVVKERLDVLETMIGRLKQLTLPSELTETTKAEFENQAINLIADLSAEFEMISKEKLPAPRHDVTAVSQEALKALSCSSQTILNLLIETMNCLKAHLSHLQELKDTLFQIDQSKFSDLDQMRQHIKSMQEKYEVIKGMENEVRSLLERQMNYNEISLHAYRKEVDLLISTHRKLLGLPSSQIITFSEEVSQFHQTRDQVIAQKKNDLEALSVEEVQKAAVMSKLDQLNVEGQTCATESDVEEWRQKLSTMSRALEERS